MAWKWTCAYDGEEALTMAKEQQYDIVLLDVMLPKLTGFEVCQQIREFSNVPIVMLTAKGDDMDKILGLEYGADDYITKPFNILEVKARIKAIMRRTAKQHAEQDTAGRDRTGRRSDTGLRRAPGLHCRKRDQSDGKRIRCAGASCVQSQQSVQPGESAEYRMGVRVSGRCENRGCTYSKTSRERLRTNPSEPKYVHTKWGVTILKDEE